MTITGSDGKQSRRLVTPPAPSSGLPFVAVRDEYIALCGGDLCAAAILSAFETWVVGKLDYRYKDADGNPNWTPEQAADIWIYKSQPEMKTDLKGLFGLSKIVTAFTLLRANGFLTARVNPEKRQDRTLQYRFEAAVVEGKLSEITAQPITSNRPDHQDQQVKPSKTTDEALNPNSSDVAADGLAASETTAGALNSNGSIPENLNKTLDKTLPEIPAGEDAREARENPAADDFSGVPNIFELYDRYGITPPLSGLQRDVLLDAAETYSPDQITFAFRDAADHGKTNWPYIRAILERLRTQPLALVPKTGGAEDDEAARDRKWRETAAELNDAPVVPADTDSSISVMPPSPGLPGRALDAWQSARQQLELQLDKVGFERGVRNTYLLDMEGDTFVLVQPSRDGAEYLRNRLGRIVRNRLREQWPDSDFRVVVGKLPPEPEMKPLARWLGEAEWTRDMARERETV